MRNEHKHGGGPAFPVDASNDPGIAGTGVFVSQGMTLRDWFAGLAMSGSMADPSYIADASERAFQAYQIADAMLSARGAE